MRWDLGDRIGWGEDQDVWRGDHFADLRAAPARRALNVASSVRYFGSLGCRPEHPLTEQVALDLVGAAGDGGLARDVEAVARDVAVRIRGSHAQPATPSRSAISSAQRCSSVPAATFIIEPAAGWPPASTPRW